MKKKYFVIVNLILLGCALIWTLTNVGYDEQYQVAMAYRLVSGDKMFTQMWEPHQTSAFICGIFVWLYHFIAKSYTGVMVFLHVVGLLIRAVVAFVLYRTLKKEVSTGISYAAAVVSFLLSPKDFSIPEFGNVQVWLGILIFCSLLNYFRSKKTPHLIVAALCLCLQILAYPSCIIVYIPAVILLAKYCEKNKKIKSIVLFTAVCLIFGIVYAAYFCITLSPSTIIENVRAMLALEPGHTVSAGTKLLAYLRDIGELLLCFGAVGVIGAGITAVVCAIRNKSKSASENTKEFASMTFLLSTAMVLVVGFLLNILLLTSRCAYTVIIIYIIACGVIFVKSLNERERRIHTIGVCISITGFLATLILTDLPFIVSGAYAVLAVAVSVIPICKRIDKCAFARLKRGIYAAGILFAGCLVLRCVYVRTPFGGRTQICSTFNTDMSLVRSGPMKGIISDDAGARKQQICVAEYKQYVPDNALLWIVDDLTDSAFYLVGEYKIATPSTISDPKNTENIKKYWEINPDKMPEVVAVSCYDGQISYGILANSWIMDWIENEFEPSEYVDGTYYRFYYK